MTFVALVAFMFVLALFGKRASRNSYVLIAAAGAVAILYELR